jgi:hypothetical protein
MTRKLATLALAALSASCLSCAERDRAEEGTGPGDVVRPTVVSVSVADSATGVGLIAPIKVTFSEAMDPATLTAASIGVAGYSTRGRIDYDAPTLSATLTLDTLLSAQVWHTIYVTATATDMAGNGSEPFTRAFQTAGLDCGTMADPFEPNEGPASAATVAPGTIRHSLTVCGEDKDIFRFTTETARKITVTTPIHDASADSTDYPGWQIHFMREDGEYYATLGTHAEAGGFPAYAYSFLPGTYFVEVYSSYGLDPGEYVLYDLDVAATDPCEDDAYEDNDFVDVASPLTLGFHTGLKGCDVDQDCFTVAMTNGQTLTLTLEVTAPGEETVHRRVHLDPPSGAGAAYSGTDNPVVLQVTSEADGPARITIRFWADGVDYTLDLE